MMLDIDRLHNIMNGRIGGRSCGRTYAMCVEILQNIDFCKDDIYVYAGDYHRADWLKDFFWRIAVEMDYEYIEDKKKRELKINGVRVTFKNRKFEHDRIPCLEYFDHDYHRYVNERIRISNQIDRKLKNQKQPYNPW